MRIKTRTQWGYFQAPVELAVETYVYTIHYVYTTTILWDKLKFSMIPKLLIWVRSVLILTCDIDWTCQFWGTQI